MNTDDAKPKAVVLLSGGLDSTTVLAIARQDGFSVHSMTFGYGQRHSAEIEAAAKIAVRAGVAEHTIVDIDLRAFGGSALTTEIAVPKGRSFAEMGQGIPITYVPARNTIFLSFALAKTETVGANDIYIGVNALDYSGYPDCRSEFIQAFQRLANLATKAGVEAKRSLEIHTPLINLTKSEIIRTGLDLGVDYSMTVSCYDPDSAGRACGQCDACLLRLKGFSECGEADPVPYQNR